MAEVRAKAVRAIVVTYNSAEYIAQCLRSLDPSAAANLAELVVVDNGSTDDTVSIVRGFANVRIVELAGNLGFAAACNVGINLESEGRKEILAMMLVNPDVALPDGSLDILLDILNESPDAAGISPLVIRHSGLAKGTSNMRTLWGMPVKERLVGGQRVWETDRLHGACMLIRTEALEKVGPFEESYFLYWEEIDFCIRARNAGWRMMVCPDILIGHRINMPERTHRIYYMWRNQVHFASKNFGACLAVTFLARRLFFANIKESIGFLMDGRSDLVCAGIAGFVAGLRGERGRSFSSYAAPPGQAGADGKE